MVVAAAEARRNAHTGALGCYFWCCCCGICNVEADVVAEEGGECIKCSSPALNMAIVPSLLD